jgi:hypothetical protein
MHATLAPSPFSLAPNQSYAKQLALARAVRTDETGFWTVKYVYPGRGFSSITVGEHVCENGVAVSQRFYNPGPFDVVAYGVDSPAAVAKSTYTVYTGIYGLPDEVSKYAAVALIKEAHPLVDARALKKAEVSIWSPDGEGALFMQFADLEVEEALRFAQSLDAELVLAS